MSETLSLAKSPRGLLFYALAGALALFQLGVVWLMLHPTAVPDYRAYYIDKSTTCLNQPRSGAYVLGDVVSFTSENFGPGSENRVCGWEGPAADGLHAVGETSRLRFDVGANAGPLLLRLEVEALDRVGYPRQRVALSANGVDLADPAVPAGQTRTLSVCIPAGTVAADGKLDLFLDYPDAIVDERNSARNRSIKLRSASIETLPTPAKCSL